MASNTESSTSRGPRTARGYVNVYTQRYCHLISSSIILYSHFVAQLNISDDQQPTFRIFPSEIGSFALGASLSDQELYGLCRKHGDPSGGLKFFVSPSADRPPLHYDPGYNSGLAPVRIVLSRFSGIIFSNPWGRAGVFYRKPCRAMLKMGSADPISVFSPVVAHREPPKTER